MAGLVELMAGQDMERASIVGAAADFGDGHIYVPRRVRVRDGRVEWNDDGMTSGPARRRLDGGCLPAFLRLAYDSTQWDRRCEAFVRRYGVLSLGEDGWPTDTPPIWDDPDVPPMIGPSVQGQDGKRVTLETYDRWTCEPVVAWRAWALHAQVVLGLGIALRGGRRIVPDVRLQRDGFDPGPKEDEIEIGENSPFVSQSDDGKLVLSDLGYTVYHRLLPWHLIRDLNRCETGREQRARLAREIDVRWLHVAEYGLRLDWSDDTPRLRIDRPLFDRLGYNVHWCFPTLAGQMVAWLASSVKMNVCSCGQIYPVKRRRANGRCAECDRILSNASAQRSKARRKER